MNFKNIVWFIKAIIIIIIIIITITITTTTTTIIIIIIKNINSNPREVILFMTINKLTYDLFFFEKFKGYHTCHCGKNQPQKQRKIVPLPA